MSRTVQNLQAIECTFYMSQGGYVEAITPRKNMLLNLFFN